MTQLNKEFTVVGILSIIAACLLWALDTLIRYPLVEKGISPLNIVLFEHVILCLIFVWPVFASIKKVGELKIADVFSFIIVGGVGSAIATVAFTESFLYLNPSLVILLQKFQPVIAISLAAIVLKEPIDKRFIIWALVCLIGGFLISSPDIERFYKLIVTDFSKVVSDGALKGYGLVAISILGWGAATVYGKRLSLIGYETKSILAGRFLLGLIFLIPFARWDKSIIFPEGEVYLRLIIMVIISGALAMWLYYRGLARIPAKTAAIAEMFFPFFAIVVNWFFLEKPLTQIQLIGGAILLVGSLVIQIKKY